MIKENIARLSIPQHVKLVAVTKNVDVSRILEAVNAGIKCIGENKVQEAKLKFQMLPAGIEKHMIGHLQTNKVKDAVMLFDVIQSIDSIKLLAEVDRRCMEIGKVMPVLIEINIGSEESKSGINADELQNFLKEAKGFPNITVEGLMCIAPIDEHKARLCFRKMKGLFDASNLKLLSMGMSNDYKIAIEEGSNMVRIGTAIFGEREP